MLESNPQTGGVEVFKSKEAWSSNDDVGVHAIGWNVVGLVMLAIT
jgi:hypothetical protein